MQRLAIIILSGSILVYLDLFLKGYFHNLLQYGDIFLLGDFLRLHLSYNTGIAFSFPINGILLKIVTPIIVIGIILYYFYEEYSKHSRILDFAYTCLISGAISHTYERIFIGHVVDFIALKYFAIFNLADILIVIGAILIITVHVCTRKHG